MGKVRWTIRKVYDALTSEFIREIRTNDIVNLTGFITTGTVVASTIVPSSYNYYPYVFRADLESTADSLVLLKNSATMAIITHKYGQLAQMVTDPDRNPICRFAAGDTIKIAPLDAATGTYATTLIMKRVPINTKINTG